MKAIKVKYNAYGKISNCDDTSVYFEQENNSLQIVGDIETEYSVRAYIKASNNNSTVTEALEKTDMGYIVSVGEEYMSKGTLNIGFEAFDQNGYIERYEPVKVYIDSFVNLGNSVNDNVYVVTAHINQVETLNADEIAYVENVGTSKDLVLNIGIPQGIQGIPGNTPQKGVDYYTPHEIAEITAPVTEAIQDAVKATYDTNEAIQNSQIATANTNDAIQRAYSAAQNADDKAQTAEEIAKKIQSDADSGVFNGEQGIQGIQGIQGEPGYTPQKGIDYYTEEEKEEFLAPIEEARTNTETAASNANTAASNANTAALNANQAAEKANQATVEVNHIITGYDSRYLPVAKTDGVSPQTRLSADAYVKNYRIYGNSVQYDTPTPETPVEVKCVGDLVTSGEYVGKYRVEAKVVGENLFKVGTVNDYSGQKISLKITDNILSSMATDGDATYAVQNSTYPVVKGDKFNFSTIGGRCLIRGYDGNGNVLNSGITGGTYNSYYKAFGTTTPTATFTVNSDNVAYVSFGLVFSGTTYDTVTISEVMVTKNLAASKYEPYRENIVTAYLNEPLRKIGNYGDYIDYENQKVVRNIRLMTIPSTQWWTMSSDVASRNTYRFYTSVLSGRNPGATVYSEYFPNKEFNSNQYIDEEHIAGNNTREASLYLYVYVNKSRLNGTTTEELISSFKAWFSDKTTILYVLEEPQEESMLIETMSFGEGTNNICLATETRPSNIELEYYQNPTLVIEELRNAILSQGGNV